jgi:hypothetical protein
MTAFVEGCEVEEGTWSGHPHWTCDRCGLSTVDRDNAVRRCQAVREQRPQTLTSDAGLLGPDGKALPESESDWPKHVGGGWYELQDGSKVQGYEDAVKAAGPQTHDEA